MHFLYCGSIHIVNIVRCIAMSLLWVYAYSTYCQMHCSVFIVGLHLQYMLLDTLQCLLWVYTYSKRCQMHYNVLIMGLYLQQMLLDALQCLYCGSIPTVNIVRCIAVSLLWVYTYSKFCYMQCSVFIMGLYLQ